MNPEFSLAVEIFSKALFGLRDSGVDDVASLARNTIQRINNKSLIPAIKGAHFYAPSTTTFYEFDNQDIQRFQALIVLNIDYLRGDHLKKTKADLLRTLYIANQYPLNGFERRRYVVMQEALNMQRDWLEESKTPVLLFDPREDAEEYLIEKLLGEENYYMDVGFEDWQSAVDAFAAKQTSEAIRFKILGYREDVGTFVKARAKWGKVIHEKAVEMNDEFYFQRTTADSRARAAAMAMIVLTTVGEERRNN